MHKNRALLSWARGQKKKLGLSPSFSRREFGYTIGIATAVGKHPFCRNGVVAIVMEPLAVISCVARDPTLKVVSAISGKDFARMKIIGKMTRVGEHKEYLQE